MIIKTEKKKYIVEAPKMNCDYQLKSIPDGFMGQCNTFNLIIGKPGSGKTSVVFSSLFSKNRRAGFLRKKYHRIFLFSPSANTLPDTIKNTFEKMEEDSGEQRLFNEYDEDELNNIIEKYRESDKRILIILDDVIADLPKDNTKEQSILYKILFNRRHICCSGGKNSRGALSLMLISQRWLKIPKTIRMVASHLVLFKLPNEDYDDIINCYIDMDKDAFYTIKKDVYKHGENNFMMIQKDPLIIHKNFSKQYIIEEEEDD